MTEDETDIDAAERALGTLPREGESAEDMRRREAWERRLAPLLSAIPRAQPPEDLLERIEARLDAEAAVIDLAAARRRLARWKGTALALGAVAAGLVAYVGLDVLAPKPAARYLAIVTSDADGTPAMIVQVDPAEGIATVIPIGVSPPPAASFEMWQLPVGATRPQSLGLLPEGPVLRRTIEAGPGDTFAISLEPPGGSPTGQPTDARYHGKVFVVENTSSR